MEFPTEIWREIMGYFHSHWRCASHYIAAAELFNKNPKTGWRRVCEIYDSYYLFIISSSWIYWSVPRIQHLLIPPDVLIRRGCAKGRAYDDFMVIWSAYALRYPSHHILSNVCYDVEFY
jgi:hypothetical protein